MEFDQLKKQIEEGIGRLSTQLEETQEKYAEEVENIGEAHKETKDLLEGLEESISMQKERLDEIEKKQNRIDGNTQKPKIFKDGLQESLEDSKEKLVSMSKGNLKETTVEVKEDMTTGNTYTGEVIEADRLQGVHFDPDRPSHVRQFIPQISTTSDLIRYVQETSYNDGTSGQAEGQEKGQSDFDLSAATAEVKTRAAYLRLSRQMLDDTAFLTGYINQRAPKKLFIDEDNQILFGDGTGENVEGITEVAQTYSEILDNVDNRWDVLQNGITQARTQNGEYMANLILINPVDRGNLLTSKGTDGHYLFPDTVRTGAANMTVDGVRVVDNTAIPSSDFIVGDFSMGATMALRQGVSIQFFEEDRDNVITNQVTVRIEERYALPIHNPNAFVYGDFTSALPS